MAPEDDAGKPRIRAWAFSRPPFGSRRAPLEHSACAAPLSGAELPGGAGQARVIAGALDGARGPARTFTPINVWDVRLNRDGEATLDMPGGHTAMLVVLGGDVVVNGEQTVGEAEVVLLSRDGADVSVHAASDATLLALTGEPIDEPIVGYGPFVMNSQAEIVQAIDDFNSGRFAGAA